MGFMGTEPIRAEVVTWHNLMEQASSLERLRYSVYYNMDDGMGCTSLTVCAD